MKLELFFDYACPYCYRGHKNLLELLPQFPDLDIAWKPCESHPRPESYGPHSDLAIQGMYYLQEHKKDLMAYHIHVYEALFQHGLNISDPDVLAQCAKGSGADLHDFAKAIAGSRYETQVLQGNHEAWSQRRLSAVPSYCLGSRFLGSHDGVMVSKQELYQFLCIQGGE